MGRGTDIPSLTCSTEVQWLQPFRLTQTHDWSGFPILWDFFYSSNKHENQYKYSLLINNVRDTGTHEIHDIQNKHEQDKSLTSNTTQG